MTDATAEPQDQPFFVRQLPWFLEQLKPTCPDLVDVATQMMTTVMKPGGALDEKTKQLITMALDIAAGQQLGTQHMAQMSRDRWGATEQEIGEVVAVVAMHGALVRLAIGSLAMEGAKYPSMDDIRSRES